MAAVPLVIPLLYLCAFAVAYGMLIVYRGQSEDADGGIKGLLLWLAGVVGGVRIPIPGHSVRPFGVVADSIKWLANAVETALAAAVGWFDAPVAQFWHLLAEVPAQTAAALASFASATAHKLAWIERTYVPQYVNRALTGALSPLAALAAKVRYMVAHTIPAIRVDVAGLEAWFGRTAKQVRAHERRLLRLEKLLGVTAMTAAVAVALDRLGMKWLRCSALNRIGRKHGCSPWQLLEMLLAPTVAILALQDMCALVKIIQRAAIIAEPVLEDFVVTGEGFLCGGDSDLASGIVASDRTGSHGFASGVLAADLGR